MKSGLENSRDTLLARLDRFSWLAAAIGAAVILCLSVAFGSRAASGADSFGYVSQAQLWLAGDLRIEQPLAREVPWPHPRESLTPLGYRPGATGAIVPVYAAGVPLMMAVLQLVAGDSGPYLLAPFCGALLVGVTFLMAVRLLGSRLAGGVAAVLMASSPAFLFNVMWPMSDTATAVLWMSALYVLTGTGVKHAGAAGMLAGLAILVRPNLVPLALPCLIAAEAWVMEPRRRGRRAAAFLAGVVPAAVAVALLNEYLNGSPFLSGYGPTRNLYSWAFVPGNLERYSRWLIETEHVVVALALLGVVWARMRPAGVRPLALWPLGLFAALVAASYLFYLPYDEWWYLRFVLPAFPLLFILAAAGIVAVARKAPPALSAPVLLILVVALAALRGGMAYERGALDAGFNEDRYVAVAEYVKRVLPGNAVLLSMQHSGSLRYYSGRLTVRYDTLSATRLVPAIEWLQARGYEPYLVIDDSEYDQFRQRFEGQGPIGRLELRILGAVRKPVGVKVYDPRQQGVGGEHPFQIEVRERRPYTGPSPLWRSAAENTRLPAGR
jgi:hypothetical protein